ncbi:hypothetical protein [Streptomyces syringium]|uniref:Flippase GtrA n=1 Tax=Streptomyces syringium TaxID=76729 RepID=A0ABS4Y1H3_9ACTN|nr:hypothetical protein [Streptomyces syringium]MBP2402495.1 putative flippase GtrA [Streptomyces syringium]
MRGIRSYWGFLAAALLVVVWGKGGAWQIIFVLSLAVSAWALFQVPVWCGAVNRDGRTYCRENASGLLMGCRRRQHRWQKLKMVVARSKAGDVSRAIFPTAKDKFAAFIAVGGLASAIAAVVVPVIVDKG